MTAAAPRVTVCIPVHQGEGVIADCLDAVFHQTFPADQYEVVVINNGSTDRTAEVVSKYPVRVADEPRRGVGFARNACVAHARGDLLAFTDADCIADREWLERLVARFDGDEGLGGVGGYLPGYDPQTPIQYYVVERDLLSQEVALADRPYSAPFLITANALMVRRLVEEAGGFDTAFPTNGEDADLCWRIADKGWRFAFAPDAVVHHRHRASVRGFCRWMFRYGQESVYLLKKHRARYGLGRVFLDGDHYRRWLAAVGRFLSPWQLGHDAWERRFAWYDVLRFSCYTAGRVAGSIKYRAIIL